jgi:hypothetical protein
MGLSFWVMIVVCQFLRDAFVLERLTICRRTYGCVTVLLHYGFRTNLGYSDGGDPN